MKILETERLLLYRWDPRFEQDFVRLATDPRVTRYIGGGQPWTEARASGGLGAWLGDGGGAGDS
jgi:hypothetical protein